MGLGSDFFAMDVSRRECGVRREITWECLRSIFPSAGEMKGPHAEFAEIAEKILGNLCDLCSPLREEQNIPCANYC